MPPSPRPTSRPDCGAGLGSPSRLTLDLAGGRAGRQSTEVRDIGYGGLSFTYVGDRVPDRLQGEIVQRYSSEAHPATMRPVSVVRLRSGRLRVGCAYEA